jgi:hypothetical protein
MKFISDISLWWLIPWLVIAGFLAFFFYRKEAWTSGLNKVSLLSLKIMRTCSLFILGLLLLGILFESIQYTTEKPLYINLVDNSSSMLNYKDSASVKSEIKNSINSIKEKYKDRFEFIDYTIGESVSNQTDFNLNEPISNLEEGFELIRTRYYNRNIGGITFYSDGNFNQGVNPLHSVEKIGLTPVFTVAVGDTVAKRDAYIKNVSSNEVAFLNNQFPVEVDIEAFKIGRKTTTISIIHQGKVVAKETVSFEGEKYDYKHFSFLLDAKSVGYQQYFVVLGDLENEYTYTNNKKSFYIEVIDSRSKVLILAGAPHPDLVAVKSVLEKDDNLEVITSLISEWDAELKGVDLIVWHEPGIDYEAGLQMKLQGAQVPILYVLGPNTKSSIIQKLQVGITSNLGTQVDEVQAALNSNFKQFEVSKELQTAIQYFPPLNVKFGQVKLGPGNDVLLFQRLGNVAKDDPVLFFGKNDKTKYGVIFGEGIWRWKLNEFQRKKSNESFNELFQKIAQYLLVKQNASSLRVTFPKRFTKADEIWVKAEFYNESMDLITTPIVQLAVKDDNGKLFKSEFAVTGNFYNLTLGKLKPGKYTWEASCSHNEKKYSKKGVFIVEDIQIENLDTRSNYSVLEQISTVSNGKFYPLSKANNLLIDINEREDMVSVSYKESSFESLIDYKLLFIVLILLFGVEWFLRRRWGAY